MSKGVLILKSLNISGFLMIKLPQNIPGFLERAMLNGNSSPFSNSVQVWLCREMRREKGQRTTKANLALVLSSAVVKENVATVSSPKAFAIILLGNRASNVSATRGSRRKGGTWQVAGWMLVLGM